MTDIASPVPAPVAGAEPPPISRAIYGMLMFATLAARELAATASWYTDGLGFIDLFTVPGPDGTPILVHLRRWQFQDLLVRPARGPVNPGGGCQLSFTAARPPELADPAFSARMRQWTGPHT
jgi:hypothetical protein